MKKLHCLLISAALILIALAPAYAQVTTSKLKSSIARKLLEREDFYMSNRVKTMCQEWPGCKEWVKERLAADSSFVIVDGEVERRLSSWKNNEAVWQHHFYVQTREDSHIKAQLPQPVRGVTLMGNMENSQTKTYRFDLVKNGRKFTSSDPVEINKFPGHPIPGNPSQHVRYHMAISGNDSLYKCQQWDKCKEFVKKKKAAVSKAVDSQYIYAYDENGNALWARNLYVQLYYYAGGGDSFVFRAKQQKAEGKYTYEDPHQIMQCPRHPDFTF